MDDIKKRAAAHYNVHSTKRHPGERWVYMSDALTRAGHGLNLSEKRLIASAISKLDSRKPFNPNEIISTRITAHEYAITFEVDLNTAYEALQIASRQIFERKITFYQPAHKRDGKNISDTKIQMRWVGKIHYQKGEGWVELYWIPDLIPHLIGLKKQFTKYQLKQTKALRSIYSWKLLELLSKFRKTGIAEYSIDDFSIAMGATENQKKNFAAIRIKIIEPSVKELVEKYNFDISTQFIKSGRKVSKIIFKFSFPEEIITNNVEVDNDLELENEDVNKQFLLI